MSPAVREVAKMLQHQKRVADASANYATLAPYLNPNGATSYFTGQYADDGSPIRYNVGQYLANRAVLGKGKYTWNRLARSAAGSIAHELGADRGSGRKIGDLLYRTGNRMYAGGGGYVPVGRGAYSGPTGAVNSLITGSDVSVPRMQGGDEIGSVVISHREYLGNITGSQLFENSTFQLNPGLVGTFPWLSQIAVNYEEYSFEQLMFTYTSLLSEATASGAVGSIIMTTNYNAGNPAFASSTDMLNNIGTVSARPTDTPIIHGIECDDEKNVLPSYYVRVGAVPSGQDIKTYDVGLYQIATEGMPVNDQLQGQLWVSYQIVLRKPKLFTAAGKGILCDYFKSNAAIASAKMTGNPLYYNPLNTIGCTLSTPASNRLRVSFPANIVQGTFRIVLEYYSPLVGGVYPVTPAMAPTYIFSNCANFAQQTNAESWTTLSQSYQTAVYNAEPAKAKFEVCVILLGSYAIATYVDFNFASLGAFTASQMTLQVIQINPRMVASAASVPPPEWLSLSL